MFKFGFELEGFCVDEDTDGNIFPTIPDKKFPTDGFPGLVELRTSGGQALDEAYADIIRQMVRCPSVNFQLCRMTFSAKQRAELRRRYSEKTAWDIRNIYDKSPKLLGNTTIASLQVNISNILSEARTDDKGVYHAARYGLFDVPQIVRNLDQAFRAEITEAKRQPGEYCVKDSMRLEYRSLPNFVFEANPVKAQEFLDKINKCVNY